jgi:S-DNA-T family DNA segregation ATPase FtsK/SpoIIIE
VGLLVAPGEDPATAHVLVVDADGLTQGRANAAREVLSGAGRAVAGIVLADRPERLPSATSVVIDLRGPDGALHHTVPAAGDDVDDVIAWGVSEPAARAAARALARYEDSELLDAAGALPERVLLPALLDADPTADALASTWCSVSAAQSLVAVLGATERGPLTVDLVSDGPHALVAGTTGSGKSELLRSFVAGLAAHYPPTELTFVLVDYKGGSAFDECARLPHTVGLVTDLDEELGSRALVCLEAELRHRERVLRDAGATDLAEYAALGRPGGPLPRLVVVIDEFATMAAELPDFIDSLVGVAQRGRSLGVHLVLATQRPGGAVKDSIRANTNLRIALRVQDAADSTDVIGTPAAAQLSRRLPGRALLRLGPGEVLPFQSALATGASARAGEAAPVAVRPLAFGPASGTDPIATTTDGPSDLLRLVEAARGAAATLGLAAPRQPWPAPLPTALSLDAVPAGDDAGAAALGLADDPARQRQHAYEWSPARGNLLVYGMPGSGTSTVLATAALSLAQRHDPRDLHLYVMDFGNQCLAPLAALPHVAAVLQPAERERQERVVRRLRQEVLQRQARRAAEGAAAPTLPTVVLLLDGWGAFESAFDDMSGLAVREELSRVIADGPGVGVHVIATADRAMGVPGAVSTLVAQKLLLRLADRHDYASFGLRTALHDPPPGRGIDVTSGLVVQVALTAGRLDDAVADIAALHGAGARSRGPRPVGVLPDEVKLDEVDLDATIGSGEWQLPLGLAATTLDGVALRVRGGEGVLVTGPARSGKTSVLAMLGAVTARHLPDVEVTALLGRRGAPDEFVGARTRGAGCDLEALADDLATATTPQLLLVDDVDDLEDPSGALTRLVAGRHAHVVVVAAGRADALRGAYDHVTVELRRSRVGVALRPRIDSDGDLWGVLLPRYGPSRFGPGRGYLVADGEAELVQVALP